MSNDGSHQTPAELLINDSLYMYSVNEGRINLQDQSESASISGLSPGKILAVVQQSAYVLHRTFNDVIYLWVVYDQFIDFVFCDAKSWPEMTAGIALKFLCPPTMGQLSRLEVSYVDLI